jgi:hypothetical protein
MEKDGGFDDERSPRADEDRARGLPIDSLPALAMDRAVFLDMAEIANSSQGRVRSGFRDHYRKDSR